jgi:four helix bundle protein
MRNHYKLQVFQLADALAMQIYAITRGFPNDEQFGLTSQLRRAAVSVGANIVEGAARPSKREYVRFLTIAYGSAQELEYELSLATRLGYVGTPASESATELASRTSKALRGLIAALSTARAP